MKKRSFEELNTSSVNIISTQTEVSKEEEIEEEDVDEIQEEEEEEPLYCLCKTPNDAKKPMIACDSGCDDWYHLACVNLSRAEASKVSQFTCPLCLLKTIRTRPPPRQSSSSSSSSSSSRSNNPKRQRIEVSRPHYSIPIITDLHSFDMQVTMCLDILSYINAPPFHI